MPASYIVKLNAVADEHRIPSWINVEAIACEYAPYYRMTEFAEGFSDYLEGHLCDTKHGKGVEGQAYDRGYEAGMRVKRFARFIDESVGSN